MSLNPRAPLHTDVTIMQKARSMELDRQILNDGQNRGPLPMMTDDGLQFQRADQVADQVLSYNQQTTLLAKVFFHPRNIKIVQNAIRKSVYDASQGKFLISSQSPMELIAIMRSIYLQYARHVPHDITQQVEALNVLVVEDQTPLIIRGIQGYLQFSSSIMAVPTPMALPQHMSTRGNKLYADDKPSIDMSNILKGAGAIGGAFNY